MGSSGGDAVCCNHEVRLVVVNYRIPAAEARKLNHLGLTFRIGRSTLADANRRRSELIFEEIYRQLYYYIVPIFLDRKISKNKDTLSHFFFFC